MAFTSTISRATFNRLYAPGLRKIFVDKFKEYPPFWKQLCKMETSKRAYEEFADMAYLGLFYEKNENEEVVFDDPLPGGSQKVHHKTYALGVTLSWETIEDDLYGKMKKAVGSLAVSSRQSKEIVFHLIFNKGTTTDYFQTLDGQAIFSASHTRLDGTTFSNLLTSADLTHSSLWSAVETFRKFRSERGFIINQYPTILLVPVELEEEAYVITTTERVPGSADWDVNILAQKGKKMKVVVDPYLTDDDAWYLLGPDHTIMGFQRSKLEVLEDTDIKTFGSQWVARERYSFACPKPTQLLANVPT